MTRARFPDGAVDVWLGAPREADAGDLALLSAAERNRVRLLRGPAALSYAAAHAGVRRILADYLGVDAHQLRLGRTLCPECGDPAHGPPRVVWPDTRLTFNLSRADGYWLLGVGEGRPLGVDLEASPRIDPELTAPLTFTRDELDVLRNCPEEQRRELFLRCWTRKEAVVKAVGVGLAADLCQIEVLPQFPGPIVVRYGLAPGLTDWELREPGFGPGLHAAVARLDGSSGPVRTFRYRVDPLPSGRLLGERPAADRDA